MGTWYQVSTWEVKDLTVRVLLSSIRVLQPLFVRHGTALLCFTSSAPGEFVHTNIST